MTSTCEVCGADLGDAVTAIIHYERAGGTSLCDKRVARLGRLEPAVVISLGVGKDRRDRRRAAS